MDFNTYVRSGGGEGASFRLRLRCSEAKYKIYWCFTQLANVSSKSCHVANKNDDGNFHFDGAAGVSSSGSWNCSCHICIRKVAPASQSGLTSYLAPHAFKSDCSQVATITELHPTDGCLQERTGSESRLRLNLQAF